MIEHAVFWRLVEARAAATPDVLMAVDRHGREMSFAQYRDAALRAAAGLADRGLLPGDIVSWILPTWLESMVLVGALARLGAVQNPILPSFRAREVRFIVNQCKPSLIVSPNEWRGFDYGTMVTELAASRDETKTLIVDRALPEADPAGLTPHAKTSATEEDATRWTFYTSGTTADPKGARHTDASLWAAAKGLAEALRLDASDRVAFVFPLTHIGGINWIQAALASGCAMILIDDFAAQDTIATLRKHAVTQGAAGTVFHEAYLEAHRRSHAQPLFPAIRAFPGGGAPKPATLHFDIQKEMGGAGILSGYGMTEAPILTMNRIDEDDAEKLARTEGRVANAEVDLRIVRSDERLAAIGEKGEIRVRGPQLFQGYVDTALDRTAFDRDGYFRTGDLGHLDARGYLVITGRSKDVIIRKGENISAGEIEGLLHLHPKIAEAVVVGLPDAVLGERCCAIVVSRDAGDPLSHEEMISFLVSHELMKQKIPEQLELVRSLPRSSTGKVQKSEIRKRLMDAFESGDFPSR